MAKENSIVAMNKKEEVSRMVMVEVESNLSIVTTMMT